MQFDVRPETLRSNLISFGVLARQIPPSRQGRPVAISTLHRWRRGMRGVHLDAVCIGGRWYTSTDAFQRFCSELTRTRDSPPNPHSCPSQADKAVDAAGDRAPLGLRGFPATCHNAIVPPALLIDFDGT
jgi:hypothetical protein